MKLKYTFLFVFISLTLLLASTAFAAYFRSIEMESASRIVGEEQEGYFDIDFEIIDRIVFPDGIRYVIEFELIYYGPTDLDFWDMQFRVPEDSSILEIQNAKYELTGEFILISSLENSSPIASGETFIFTLIIFTSDPDYEPNDFIIDDTELEKVLRPRLSGELNLVSISGNTRTYNIIITNTGDATSLNWRMSLQTAAGFQFRSISPNVNFISQTNTLIISNVSGFYEIGPNESVTINLVYNGAVVIEILNVISQEDDAETNTNRPSAELITSLNRISTSGNTHIYNIVITNNGNMVALNWELGLRTAGNNFRVRSLTPTLNHVLSTGSLIIFNLPNTLRIAPNESITIVLELGSNSATPIEFNYISNW